MVRGKLRRASDRSEHNKQGTAHAHGMHRGKLRRASDRSKHNKQGTA